MWALKDPKSLTASNPVASFNALFTDCDRKHSMWTSGTMFQLLSMSFNRPKLGAHKFAGVCLRSCSIFSNILNAKTDTNMIITKNNNDINLWKSQTDYNEIVYCGGCLDVFPTKPSHCLKLLQSRWSKLPEPTWISLSVSDTNIQYNEAFVPRTKKAARCALTEPRRDIGLLHFFEACFHMFPIFFSFFRLGCNVLYGTSDFNPLTWAFLRKRRTGNSQSMRRQFQKIYWNQVRKRFLGIEIELYELVPKLAVQNTQH